MPIGANAMPDAVSTALPRLTPSSVADLECPLKYKTLRIDRNWGTNNRDFGPAIAHGTAVHDVLRQVIRTRTGDEAGLEHVEALARQAVYRGRYPEGTDRGQATEKVLSTVRAYVDSDDDIGNTLSVERPEEFDYWHNNAPLFRVSVKLDRVLVRPDAPTTLVIRDYKLTARPKISLPEAMLYLWAAKKAFRDQGFTEFLLEYDFIDPDNRVTREVVSGHDVRGQHPLIVEAAVKVIRATDWPPCVGEACVYCPLRGKTCHVLPAEHMKDGQDVF